MAAERGLPVSGPISGTIRLPGSKSVSIRALAVAALAQGRSHLYGGLIADDTAAMAAVLEGFGVRFDATSDPWVIDGGGLTAPTKPLDAMQSGLSARIAIAMAALVDGVSIIEGQGRLRRRPMKPLLDAWVEQGIETESVDGRLPVTVHGTGRLPGGEITVDGSLSSQFATAILLVAPLASAPTELRVEGTRVSEGYMSLTTEVMSGFGVTVAPTITGFEVPTLAYQAADLEIEPDLSAGVYPMVAAAITSGRVSIEGVRHGTSQPDMDIARCLATMGCEVSNEGDVLAVQGPEHHLTPITADLTGSPDGALALAVACLFAEGTSTLSGLGTLRHKESDRLSAIVEGIRRLGGVADIDGDTLVITPGPLHGGIIDPHGDHRVAMSLALAGLRIEGVLVSDPDVVDKTWPGYWTVMGELCRG
jgi:3-phosphoshikimate 1-carboxyvinyltransferase